MAFGGGGEAVTPGGDREGRAAVGRGVRRAAALLFVLAGLGLTPLVMAPPPALAAPPLAEAAEHYDQGRVAAAARIWREQAETGTPAAQVALAGLYANAEIGDSPDFAAAARWYRRAARQGNLTAQINLGDFHARGRGVPRDPVRAWVWLRRAAEQGSTWAVRRAEAVAAEMTPAQRAAAKARMESETAP